jgi:predicted transcriptional regulator
MEDYVKQALEIVKAQASVRNRTEEELTSMVRSLTEGIKNVAEGTQPEPVKTPSADDAKKAIREKSIICMECEKSFKVLTKRHLATHGLTPEQYRKNGATRRARPWWPSPWPATAAKDAGHEALGETGQEVAHSDKGEAVASPFLTPPPRRTAPF